MTRLCTCPGSFKSTSELYEKRTKVAEASCKTCGGSFLVDGIGSISGNMLSTVGLEVAKSIQPELSWKAVTKGRRSRKAVARSLNEGMKVIQRSPKRVGDFSSSDSDKIGEAAVQSSDKVEHVPIKKRRHLLQSSMLQSQVPSSDREDSLSPQSLATPMASEDCEQIPVYTHSSDCRSSGLHSSRHVLGSERKAAHKFGPSDRVVDAKISEVSSEKLYSSEDFSGIALLAAAACINGMDDDPDKGKEAPAMLTYAAPEECAGSISSPSKEFLALKESTDPSNGDMMHASNTESSTAVTESAVAPNGLAEVEESSAGIKSVSPKVDRMYWDLNTSMDAWKQPHEDSIRENAFDAGSNAGAQKEKLHPEICDKKRDFEDFKHDSGKCVLPDQNVATSESANVKAQVFKAESISVPDRIFGEEIVFGDLGRRCTNVLDSICAKTETSGELVTGDGIPTTDSGGGLIKMPTGDSSVDAAGFCKADSSKVPVPTKLGCESASKCNDSSDPLTTSQVPDTSILNALGVESSESNPKVADCGNHSSLCEDLSASKASTTEGHSVTAETMEQHSILAADSRMQLEGKEVSCNISITSNQLNKCTTSVKESSRICDEGLQNDDPRQFAKISSALEDSHNSDISQEDRSQMIGQEHTTRLEAGYDSPFEDGELRGSIMYSWDDNEVEENECVDYESDGRAGVDSDAADHPASEIVEAGSEGSHSTEKRISSTSGFPEVDFVKTGSPRNSLRRQFNRENISIIDGGTKVLATGSGSTTQRSGDKVEGSEGVFRKGYTSGRMGASFEFRGSYMEEIGSKTNRGKLQSRIEGPLYLDVADGKSAALKYQSRPHNLTGSYHRPEREVSPDKFAGRYRVGYNSRDRGARDGQWNSWNSRNCYPSVNNGSESQSYSRRRSYADSADKFSGIDSRDHRQSINYSSEVVGRPLVRRRSSVERDDYYDVHRRIVPVRGGYRSRGGAGNFSQRFARGRREEGYEPVRGDGDLSSVRVPQYLSRGERNGSPASGRVARISLPRRRSRSRSRTRSPHTWQTQRERNFSSRRHSRSPDLRSEARMDRPRMPFRKPGFTAEYGEDFSSPPRGHCPPERSSRWIDERSFGGDQLRNKWSPMKVIRRGQKFDPVGAPGRMKPDEYNRPMMRPGRFDSMAGTGRGHKFESNYDENRRDDRYEMIHRIRDSDTGVGGRRFQPDTREDFEAEGNSHSEEDIQSTDRRDVPRSAREDKRSFKA